MSFGSVISSVIGTWCCWAIYFSHINGTGTTSTATRSSYLVGTDRVPEMTNRVTHLPETRHADNQLNETPQKTKKKQRRGATTRHSFSKHAKNRELSAAPTPAPTSPLLCTHGNTQWEEPSIHERENKYRIRSDAEISLFLSVFFCFFLSPTHFSHLCASQEYSPTFKNILLLQNYNIYSAFFVVCAAVLNRNVLSLWPLSSSATFNAPTTATRHPPQD